MPVLPFDCLVSSGAKERWLRWRADLIVAGLKDTSNTGSRCEPQELNPHERLAEQNARIQHHRQMAGVWNESQSYSPQLTATGYPDLWEIEDFPAQRRPLLESAADTPEITPLTDVGEAPPNLPIDHQPYVESTYTYTINQQGNDGQSSAQYKGERKEDDITDTESFIDAETQFTTRRYVRSAPLDGSTGSDSKFSWSSSGDTNLEASLGDQVTNISSPSANVLGPDVDHDLFLDGSKASDSFLASISPISIPRNVNEDEITDTVGAIAIDCFGNIAAASSSGGIGMKHRGRTGPAALVGIGTAVIPVDPEDKRQTCVATVTSGTGEHMATTMAASTCASRLYYNHRRAKDGRSIMSDEEGAIRGFVERDFMSMQICIRWDSKASTLTVVRPRPSFCQE